MPTQKSSESSTTARPIGEDSTKISTQTRRAAASEKRRYRRSWGRRAPSLHGESGAEQNLINRKVRRDELGQ